MISRLLVVESVDEPTEIVIHVNMLKEGWDVTNLYTLAPLRAANARTLIEQSIGRGLRLGRPDAGAHAAHVSTRFALVVAITAFVFSKFYR